MEIYINDREIKYSDFKIDLSIDKVINNCQIYIDKFEDVKINDNIYIVAFNNAYLQFKVTSIIKHARDNKYDTLVIGEDSFNNKLMRYYLKETIQFNHGVNINKILNYFNFNNVGEDFNLIYDENIIFNIGDNLGIILNKILKEHGYFLNYANNNLNISKLKSSNNSHILETCQEFKYQENLIYDDYLIFSDNYLFNNNYSWLMQNKNKNIITHQSLFKTKSLDFISNNLKKFISPIIINISVDINDFHNPIYPNDNINLSKLNIDMTLNHSFYCSHITINSNNIVNLTLKK